MKNRGREPATPEAELPLPPELMFLRQIWQLNHALERVSRAMDRNLGITAEQRMVLRVAGRFPGISAGQLAHELHVDPGTVSALLTRLESKGLVERRRDPRDVRRVLVGLTEEGHALDRPMCGTIEHAVANTLRELPATQIDFTVKTLKNLVGALSEEITRSRS